MTVRDAAKAKRRQELADDGENPCAPPLRYGLRKGSMKVVTLLINSPKQLNHLGNEQTACRKSGSRAGKAVRRKQRGLVQIATNRNVWYTINSA